MKKSEIKKMVLLKYGSIYRFCKENDLPLSTGYRIVKSDRLMRADHARVLCKALGLKIEDLGI